MRSTRVGYAGGDFQNPTYKDVCSGKTGHAEALEITFDPSEVSYERLLELFLGMHNPPPRPQPGYQYRSTVFYHTPRQKEAAEALKQKLEKDRKAAGFEIVPAPVFWQAEDYHQQYHDKRR